VRRRPNLFHVGHPRSGTGTVYGWLSRHPDVFMARKELHFFGSDVGFNQPRRTLGNYLRQFEAAGHQRWVGDSSTWYLSSADAADEIAAYTTDARIIVNLREPTAFLASLHAHLYANADEDLPNLWDALAAEPARRAGRSIPAGSLPKIALHYRRHVAYAPLLERFFKAFGRDRVHVLLFDDLQRDAGETCRNLLDFLGVASDPRALAAPTRPSRDRNGNWGVRSRRLQRFLKRSGNQAVYMGLTREPVPGWALGLRALKRWNAVAAPRPPLPAEWQARLRAEFRPEVERLEALLGRDLSAWKDGPQRLLVSAAAQ
jgi:hypothetical protein